MISQHFSLATSSACDFLLGVGSEWSVGSGKPPGRLQTRMFAEYFLSSGTAWVLLVELG